ncbi:MAG: GrpB family protein [Acidimicrobiales bacterium]
MVAHDPSWSRAFERERLLLEPLLAPFLEAGIHHIGGAAVAGMTAKPVIDIMAGSVNWTKPARSSARGAGSTGCAARASSSGRCRCCRGRPTPPRLARKGGPPGQGAGGGTSP